MMNSVKFFSGPSDVFTSFTTEFGEPILHHLTNSFNTFSSPSASMYTSPFGSLRTKPFNRKRCASFCVNARKNTPCTIPLTIMLKCFIKKIFAGLLPGKDLKYFLNYSLIFNYFLMIFLLTGFYIKHISACRQGRNIYGLCECTGTFRIICVNTFTQ
jgi:hypothetical protein